jgi:hypothetical protein
MYSQAEATLAELLFKEPFPALADHLDYMALMVKGKPDEKRCLVKAKKIVQNLRSSGGIREFGSKQAVQATVWRDVLYRGVDKQRRNSDGPWWVDEELVKRWEHNYKGVTSQERRAQVLKAMRAMLAVCYDWSAVDELWKMRAPIGGLPVLIGQGTYQPVNFGEANALSAAGQRDEVKVFFIGGYRQVYVPFVPKSLIAHLPLTDWA